MLRLLTIMAVLVGACGRIDFDLLADGGGDGGSSCPSPSPGERDGTRLVLAGTQFGDGSRWLNGYYDLQRDEPCQPVSWSDGNTYCVPTEDAFGVFADASCSQPLAELFACGQSMERYVATATQDACGVYSDEQLYNVGSASATTSYYESVGGSCIGPFFIAGGEALYNVGAEVPVSDLALVTTSDGTGSGALALRSYVSSDGLVADDTLVDTALGLPCGAQLDGLGTTTCLPQTRSAEYLYGDASCAGAGYAAVDTSCSPTPLVEAPPTCETPSDPDAFYSLLAPTVSPPAQLFATAGTTCEMVSPSSADTLYDVAATPLPLAGVQLAIVPDACHRIELVRAAGDGASVTVAVYDSQLGSICNVELAADGVMRCLPASTPLYAVFTDAQCTQPVNVAVVAFTPTCAAPPAPAYAEVLTGSGPCYGERIFAVGAEIDTPLYSQSGSDCESFAPTFVDQSITVYAVTTELDPTTFVTASTFHD
ncbi:MAG TPA: hypothetical protein VGL61_19955 [Kofleriaceae bacterium]